MPNEFETIQTHLDLALSKASSLRDAVASDISELPEDTSQDRVEALENRHDELENLIQAIETAIDALVDVTQA